MDLALIPPSRRGAHLGVWRERQRPGLCAGNFDRSDLRARRAHEQDDRGVFLGGDEPLQELSLALAGERSADKKGWQLTYKTR